MKSISFYINRVRRHDRPLRFLASRVLWKSGLSRWLTINCGHFRLRFFPTSLSAEYWVDPNNRAHDERFLVSYLRPGDTMVDVGANIGALTLTAASVVGATGRVLAVEAHPLTFSYLRQNVELNDCGNIDLINCALGAEPGEVSFSDLASDDQNAVTDEGALTVPMRTLDAVLDEVAGSIALLKVDVEGFEKFVFEGAERTMARTECIYYESWDTHYARYGYTAGEVVALLHDHGFEVFALSDGGIRPLDSSYTSAACENLLAARDLQAFRSRLESLVPRR